jgi:two-component system chemotaxis sensor kinase CheA
MTFLVIRILLVISLVISIYLIALTLERGRSQMRYNFIYAMAALLMYILGYLIEMTVHESGGGVVAIKIMYLGTCFMPPFFFFFVADYCEVQLPKNYYRIPMLSFSTLNYLLVATFDHHRLIYADYYYNATNPIDGMHIIPGGPLYYVSTVYSFICIGLSCFLLIRDMVRRGRSRRLALILFLISSLAPVLANLIYIILSFIFPVGGVAGINLTAFVMVISNAMLYFIIVRNDFFDLAPKAYAITLDLIRDAFVVLDARLGYSSCNKNAAALFPGLVEMNKGASILKLENWPPELSETRGGEEKKEIQFALPHRKNRMYSGWVNTVVAEEDKSTLGWVVLIQDITETMGYIKSIQAQRDEIAAMRDNLKEGIFLMDRELRIEPSYSKALEDVFSGSDFQGRPFTGLLAKSFSPGELETVKDYFTMIFEKSIDPDMLEDINPLHEFSYTSVETGAEKTLKGRFAPVDRENGEIFILGTFQDITAEVKLKKQLEEKETFRQEEMRSIFELLQVDQNVFNEFIEDTEYEFDRMNDRMKNRKLPPEQTLIEIYQSVHAIKSNALIVGLGSFGEKLHRLETKIKELQRKETVTFEDLLHITMEIEARMQDKDKFLEILNRIQTFNAQSEETIERNAHIFVELLTRACSKAASDLGKLARLEVTAFDFRALLHGQRRAMKEILTQLVRNAVYHGIEDPEKRTVLEKDKTGRISLSIAVDGDSIHMVLQDDGQGLDLDKIAVQAEAQGLIKNSADRTDKQYLTGLIFQPGFSTSGDENMYAGRGIGLNFIKDRLKDLHGSLKVRSAKGRGAVFDIQIPLAAEPET